MTIRRLLRPTNRKIRLAVGLMLTALFCIQCVGTSEADREADKFSVMMSGETVGKNAPSVLQKVEKLAKTDHAELLEFCRSAYDQRVQDYTCTLIKQERLKGSLGKPQVIACKYMRDPFSVALAWKKNAGRADRVLFVKGKYGNQMLARPAGFLSFIGTVKRDPDGPEAMKSTLRPINQFGFANSMRSLEEVYELAEKRGELTESFKGFGVHEETGRKAAILVRELPAREGYPAARTVTYIDTEYLVPTIVEGYDWDGKLRCRYIFKDIKFNVGLTESDFLPENNDMKPVD
jgi:hypothetical protein